MSIISATIHQAWEFKIVSIAKSELQRQFRKWRKPTELAVLSEIGASLMNFRFYSESSG
jgi:hypothetical protein